jgi:hypothetical protein
MSIDSQNLTAELPGRNCGTKVGPERDFTSCRIPSLVLAIWNDTRTPRVEYKWLKPSIVEHRHLDQRGVNSAIMQLRVRKLNTHAHKQSRRASLLIHSVVLGAVRLIKGFAPFSKRN